MQKEQRLKISVLFFQAAFKSKHQKQQSHPATQQQIRQLNTRSNPAQNTELLFRFWATALTGLQILLARHFAAHLKIGFFMREFFPKRRKVRVFRLRG